MMEADERKPLASGVGGSSGGGGGVQFATGAPRGDSASSPRSHLTFTDTLISRGPPSPWEETLTCDDAIALAARGGVGGLGAGGGGVERAWRLPASIPLGLAWSTHGAHLVLFSVLGPSVACVLDLSPLHTGVVMGVGLGAAALGALTWGVLADLATVGRRLALLSAIAISAVGDTCAALAPSYLPFLLCVFLAGFGAGGAHIALTLARETTTREGRRSLLPRAAAWYATGTLAEAVLAWLLLPVDAHAWRTLSALTALPALLALVGMAAVPRSARFWAAMGDTVTAVQALRDSAARDGVVVPSFAELALPEGVPRHEQVGASAAAALASIDLGTPSKARAGSVGAAGGAAGGTRSRRREPPAPPTALEGAVAPRVRGVTVRLALLWAFVAAGYQIHVMAAAQVFTPGRVDVACGLIAPPSDADAAAKAAAAAAAAAEAKVEAEWDGCNELTSSVVGDNAGLAAAELVSVAALLFAFSRGVNEGRLQVLSFAIASAASFALLTCFGRGMDLTLLAVARAAAAAGAQAAWLVAVEAFPTTCRGAGVGVVVASSGLLAAATVPIAQPLLGPSSSAPFFASIFPFGMLLGKAALSAAAVTKQAARVRSGGASDDGAAADILDSVPQMQRLAAEAEAAASVASGGAPGSSARRGFWGALRGRAGVSNPQGEYGLVGAASDHSHSDDMWDAEGGGGGGGAGVGDSLRRSPSSVGSAQSSASQRAHAASEGDGVGVGVAAALVSHPTLDAVRDEIRAAGPNPSADLVGALAARLEDAAGSGEASRRQAEALREEAMRLRLLARHLHVHTPRGAAAASISATRAPPARDAGAGGAVLTPA